MGDSAPVLDDAHRLAPAAPGETHVYGACAPGWHSAANHDMAVGQWIQAMRDRGIERVCCLLSGSGLDERTSNVGRYRVAFGAARVVHAPVPDGQLVDQETLEAEILPFLRDAAARDEPVVVHCIAGRGRTGQVLAAWLVAERGYTPRDAVEAVQETGRDPLEVVTRGNATMGDVHRLLKRVG